MQKALSLILLLTFGCTLSSPNIKTIDDKAQVEKQDNETPNPNYEKVPKLPQEVKKIVFKNGLTVLLAENDRLPIFSFYLFYEVGGKHEYPGITGASHFLEHMMFKGAKKYGPGEFDRLIEGNGGSNNAYTTNDRTVYYEKMPSAHLETIIDVEADRMQNLTLEEESFENERNVVFEERKMRYENSDQGKIYIAMMTEMFHGTPYGTSVIGDLKDLKSVTRDQIYNYFKKYYAPNNAVMVIVGDINVDKAVRMIDEKFGTIPATESLEQTKKKTYQNRGGFKLKPLKRKWVKLKGQSPVPSFTLAFPAPSLKNPDTYVVDILSSILGDGKSSYLNQNLVESKKPLLSTVSAYNYTLSDAGVFMVSGTVIDGNKLSSVKSNVLSQLQKSCDEAITERAVLKVKNSNLISYLSSFKTNSSFAQFIGQHEVSYGDYRHYQDVFLLYEQITVDQVKAACKKYIDSKKALYLTIGKQHKKSDISI